MGKRGRVNGNEGHEGQLHGTEARRRAQISLRVHQQRLLAEERKAIFSHLAAASLQIYLRNREPWTRESEMPVGVRKSTCQCFLQCESAQRLYVDTRLQACSEIFCWWLPTRLKGRQTACSFRSTSFYVTLVKHQPLTADGTCL